MVQVTAQTARKIDLLLDALTFRWERLPQVEREIDSWDCIEQLAYLEEWPLEEERLAQLRELAAAGALSHAQQARFADLLQIIAANRPILDRLLAA